MSTATAAFFVLLSFSAIAVLTTSNTKLLRMLLRLHIAVALAFTFIFFFFAARFAVPFPDSGTVPTGHILEGVTAMYSVSQVFVGALSVIAISSTLTALQLAKRKNHAA